MYKESSRPERWVRLDELHQVRVQPATARLNAAYAQPGRDADQRAIGLYVQRLALLLAEVDDALDQAGD